MQLNAFKAQYPQKSDQKVVAFGVQLKAAKSRV
jgi:hypothetical protein